MKIYMVFLFHRATIIKNNNDDDDDDGTG